MKKCVSDVAALQTRMRRLTGQLNGVIKMIGEDAPCEDVLIQISAINGALHRVALMLINGHLRHCVRDGIENGDAEATINRFAYALENFSKMA